MDHAAPSQTLLWLAEAHHVGVDYWDWQGNHVPVTADTVRAVLAGLGVDASTEQAAQQALERVADDFWDRVLPATVVMRQGWTPWVKVHVPHGTGVRLWLELEDGGTRDVRQVDHLVEPRWTRGRLRGEATFELDGDLPLGYHTLVAEPEDDSRTTATVIVTPQRLELPAALRDGRVWGLMTQLYQVRSRRSWGVGDLADLARIAEWAGRDLGADFVLVNPLHAAEPSPPMEPSPYLPTTRRFANPMYLRVEDLAELAELSPADQAKVTSLAKKAARLNTADTVDRDACWTLKRQALGLVYSAAVRPEEFRAWCAQQGSGLDTFAAWCALAEVYGGHSGKWPEELQDADSPAVAAFVAEQAERVDLHRWLQWLAERQLAQVQATAREAGMRLGVVHDLAVGVHPDGADAWGLRHALARGVTVGAPPDQFNQLGQNWHQPPWHPERLAELGYAPYREMVRALLKDAGGLRVDHVIGLFRLWWVPEGAQPVAGAYVRYDHEAMIGILVLEAQRAGAVVVGEDLGVVEPFARDYMRERGVLGTSILWFEWGHDGRLLAPEQYRELCLATVTTHDLAPTAGYLALAHVELRARLGLLTRPVAEERAQEQATLGVVRDVLRSRGLLASDDVEETVLALHSYLTQTPSKMLGVALADMVGDTRIINQPGTTDEYPNWRVPLAGPDGSPLLLEDVLDSPLPKKVADRLR